MSWARRVLTGNAFSSAKWCQECPHAVRHRHHADLGLLTVRAALALEPELALLPEDVLPGEVAKLADAEPGVEQGLDDEPLGGCLAGVGQTIRFVGDERFSHVLIRHLSPEFVHLWGRNTQPLRFPTARLPAPFGARKGLSPEKTREIASPIRFRGWEPECVIRSGGLTGRFPVGVSPIAMEATAGDYPDRRVRMRFQRELVARGLSC